MLEAVHKGWHIPACLSQCTCLGMGLSCLGCQIPFPSRLLGGLLCISPDIKGNYAHCIAGYCHACIAVVCSCLRTGLQPPICKSSLRSISSSSMVDLPVACTSKFQTYRNQLQASSPILGSTTSLSTATRSSAVAACCDKGHRRPTTAAPAALCYCLCTSLCVWSLCSTSHKHT